MEWINPNNRRYYRLIFHRDLLGDVVMTKEFGSLDSKRGQRLTEVIISVEQARARLTEIMNTRTHHGYILRKK